MVALSVISTAVGAYGAYAAQQAQNRQAEAQAKYNEMMAKDAIARGQIEADKKRAEVKRLIGSQRAGLGASGVQIEDGSAMDIQADAAKFGELDALTIKNNAERDAWAYRAQASIARASKGSAALAGASSLLAGASNTLGIYRTAFPSKEKPPQAQAG
jgi:hypothetical protein